MVVLPGEGHQTEYRRADDGPARNRARTAPQRYTRRARPARRQDQRLRTAPQSLREREGAHQERRRKIADRVRPSQLSRRPVRRGRSVSFNRNCVVWCHRSHTETLASRIRARRCWIWNRSRSKRFSWSELPSGFSGKAAELNLIQERPRRSTVIYLTWQLTCNCLRNRVV